MSMPSCVHGEEEGACEICYPQAEERLSNEVYFSRHGAALIVEWSDEKIIFTKGSHYDQWIAETLRAYDDEGNLVQLNEIHHRWMHKKLEEWIDKEKNGG